VELVFNAANEAARFTAVMRLLEVIG
jgi:hypothetical protein